MPRVDRVRGWFHSGPQIRCASVPSAEGREPRTAETVGFSKPGVADVERYLSDTGLSVRRLIHVVPEFGPSQLSVKGADHSILVADRIVQEVRRQRQDGVTGTIHLFAAAPNALLFFLGQSGRAMG